MTMFRLVSRLLLCVVAAGCTYDIVLEQPKDPMAIGPAETGETAAKPVGAAEDKGAATPADGAIAVATPAKPGADQDPITASGGRDTMMPTAGSPPEPAPGAQGDCGTRLVSRATPCSDDPDPCGLNSGWEGDEYCLKPPPPGEGVQIHFGPSTYDDPTTEYALQPNEEVSGSVLANVPLTETKYWDHVTVHFRPGVHHWTSMDAPAGSQPGVYPQNDIGCGSGRLFGSGGFGDGVNENRIYDNPPQGIAAPENEGIGRIIEGNSSVCMGLHAYNFEDKPRLREVWVNLYFVDRDKVTQPIGSILMIGGVGVSIPPGEHRELQYSAVFGEAGRIIQLFGHRLAWTPRFAAWLNDELIYDSHDWVESVIFNYDSITMNPPIDGVHDGAKSGIVPFSANDTLKYSCFVENDSGVTLTFQNELAEMCNLRGITVGGSISSTSLP